MEGGVERDNSWAVHEVVSPLYKGRYEEEQKICIMHVLCMYYACKPFLVST